MKEIYGDLISLAKEGKFDVIGHGCNCFCTMGSGIARSIREAFPEAYKADCRTTKGDKRKLGKISFGYHGDLAIANMYTQYRWSKIGPDGKRNGDGSVDYCAVMSCMKRLRAVYSDSDYRIGLPLIGCGLAQGDWNVVKQIIEEDLEGMDVTIVKYEHKS